MQLLAVTDPQRRERRPLRDLGALHAGTVTSKREVAASTLTNGRGLLVIARDVERLAEFQRRLLVSRRVVGGVSATNCSAPLRSVLETHTVSFGGGMPR